MDNKTVLKIIASGIAGLWLGKKYQEVTLTKKLLSEVSNADDTVFLRGWDKPGEELNIEWRNLAMKKITQISEFDPETSGVLMMVLTPSSRTNRLNKFIIDNSEDTIIMTIKGLKDKYGNLYESREAYTAFLSALNCYPTPDEVLK